MVLGAKEPGLGARAKPIGRQVKVELKAPRDKTEPETSHARPELGTRIPKVDQD